LIDDLHFIHLAVAFDAANTTIYVNGMIEVNVIRSLMNAHPRNRISGLEALTHWGEGLAIGENLTVAVHARISARNIRVLRTVYVGMTIATIHAELTYMQAVIIRNWLNRLITDPQILRGAIISDEDGNRSNDK
jgi:hypothetical protein